MVVFPVSSDSGGSSSGGWWWLLIFFLHGLSNYKHVKHKIDVDRSASFRPFSSCSLAWIYPIVSELIGLNRVCHCGLDRVEDMATRCIHRSFSARRSIWENVPLGPPDSILGKLWLYLFLHLTW